MLCVREDEAMSGGASIGPAQVLVGVEGQLCYVLQERLRPEARVVAQFEDHEVSTFLPLLTELGRQSDRRKRVPFSLTCVLVRVASCVETRLFLLRTVDVASLGGVCRHDTPIAEKEIEDVQTLVDHGGPLVPRPFRAGRPPRQAGLEHAYREAPYGAKVNRHGMSRENG